MNALLRPLQLLQVAKITQYSNPCEMEPRTNHGVIARDDPTELLTDADRFRTHSAEQNLKLASVQTSDPIRGKGNQIMPRLD
jgi:hypothetical protein